VDPLTEYWVILSDSLSATETYLSGASALATSTFKSKVFGSGHPFGSLSLNTSTFNVTSETTLAIP